MSEEELKAEMSKVYNAQQKCLKIQIILIFVTLIAWVFGYIPSLLNLLVSLAWGISLRKKATSLARQKYPQLGFACNGKGGWDPPIRKEAKQRNDTLTYKLLTFHRWSLLAAAASFSGYIFMVKIWTRIMLWELQNLH